MCLAFVRKDLPTPMSAAWAPPSHQSHRPSKLLRAAAPFDSHPKAGMQLPAFLNVLTASSTQCSSRAYTAGYTVSKDSFFWGETPFTVFPTFSTPALLGLWLVCRGRNSHPAQTATAETPESTPSGALDEAGGPLTSPGQLLCLTLQTAFSLTLCP